MMLFAGDTTIAAHSIYSRELQSDDFRLGLTSYQVAAHAIAQQQYEQAVEYLQVCFDAFKSDDDQMGDLEQTVRNQRVESFKKLQ